MKFRQLPLIVKIAVILTFYNTWVMIEEFIIDRFGYWKYLPFYKKGIFCTWDIVFILGFSILVFLNRKKLSTLCIFTNCKICTSK